MPDDTPVNPGSDDLDTFTADFFSQEPAKTEEKANSDVEDEVEAPGPDAPTPDPEEDEDDDNQDDTPAPDDDDEDEEEAEPAPKPKKNSVQERINELTRDKRELERRLAAIESKQTEPVKKDEPAPEPQKAASDEPDPLALNEDGTEKYPLGEFDPKYLRDVMRHEHQALLAEESRKATEKAQQDADRQEQTAIQNSWKEKVDNAKERYPDLQSKVETALDPAFEGVDARYGEYLATVVMQMDKGPDVLNYLADNVDEARRIIALGPVKASIALGKLESKFDDEAPQKQVKVKATNAPTPPPANKGTAQSKSKISPTTDDLDAFEQLFFKGK